MNFPQSANPPISRAPWPAPLSTVLVLAIAATSCGGDRPEEHEHDAEQARHQHDDASHEAEVRLEPSQIEAAGIRTITAESGTIEHTVDLVARVAANGNAVLHITPRAPGIVKRIYKGLGDRVEKGDALAELWSVEIGDAVSAYLRARSRTQAAQETITKTRALYERRIETVERVLAGMIAVAERIAAREKELHERNVSTIRPYLDADRDLQRARLERDRELVRLRAERDRELLALDVALRQARIDETAARARLVVLGFGAAEIEGLHDLREGFGRMVLHAPAPGIVVERDITLEEHVGSETTLFVVQDLSSVWVLASAYEKDLARLQQGQKAHVRLDALPGVVLDGRVELIDYRISERTRTATVRITLSNEPVPVWPVEYPLRPGMFGHAGIVVESREARVALPERAIVHEGEKSYVFVLDPDHEGAFVRKPVEIRPGSRDRVEVVGGLEPGEQVVVDGTFALKSVARGSELGEGHSH